ncbi:MAG: hypothetical protein SFZ24_10640 [Planctomycetota bacterium]|nr:hypothetical protein [Planctomycetota bacterium]
MTEHNPTHPLDGRGSPQSLAGPAAWTSLIAHWTTVAKAVTFLPQDAQGNRWRLSVAPALGLHAIAMALGDIARVPPHDRAVALDLAEIGIVRDRRALTEAWGAQMPAVLTDLIRDAEQALDLARAWSGASPLSPAASPPASARPPAPP